MVLHCSSASIGSHFGAFLFKSFNRGVLVGSRIGEPQPKYVQERSTSNGLYVCSKCKVRFKHGPALSTHSKFCKGIEAEHLPSSESSEEEEPRFDENEVNIDQLEASAPGTNTSAADEAIGDADSGSRPVKRRKSDGAPKRSGMRIGMCKTPHTLLFKYRVAVEFAARLQDKEHGLIKDPLQQTSDYFHGLSTSNIWNWYKQMDKLKHALTFENSGNTLQLRHKGKIVTFASNAARRMTLQQGRGVPFAAAEAELYAMFKARRRAGQRVQERWLVINMRKLIRTHYGDEPAKQFKGSYGWVFRLARRHNISLRRANNHKHQSVEERLPKIKRWHARLRRRLKTGPKSRLHPKWGRWLPENRLSIDQV